LELLNEEDVVEVGLNVARGRTLENTGLEAAAREAADGRQFVGFFGDMQSTCSLRAWTSRGKRSALDSGVICTAGRCGFCPPRHSQFSVARLQIEGLAHLERLVAAQG
jgi:hypothetical protein